MTILIIFCLQFEIGTSTLEKRLLYGLEESPVANFFQEAAMGGAKAIRDFYGYGHKKFDSVFDSVFNKNTTPKRPRHQLAADMEDEASR